MRDQIILIGPIAAGKSTQGQLLAEKLGLPRVAMDDVRWDYYKEIGYSEDRQKEIGAEGGFTAVYRYWKPFEIHAVERLLSEHQACRCVIDFGGGHSVYEDDAYFERARRALEPYENVVLLLPSSDLDESVRILRERTGMTPASEGDLDFCEHFVKHPSNHALAKIVVYTDGRTPEETRDEIASRVTLL
ncbi:MAG: shikimate kinase [Armatimonadetes bacterium]|nr:shikimate kinase [Armatimonadota bacterium]